MRSFKLIGSIATALSIATAAHAVSLFQTDTFSSFTTDGWGSGGPNPNPPSVITTGGPAGAGDAYLSITSTGINGSGGQLVAFNSAQWSGDYLSEGIDAIQFDIANFGNTDVNIGLRFEGPAGTFLSLTPVLVPAGAGWTQVSLGADAASLGGAGDPNGTLAATTRLRIQDPTGSHVSSVGVDNITAIPEPASLTLLLVGAGFVARRR